MSKISKQQQKGTTMVTVKLPADVDFVMRRAIADRCKMSKSEYVLVALEYYLRKYLEKEAIDERICVKCQKYKPLYEFPFKNDVRLQLDFNDLDCLYRILNAQIDRLEDENRQIKDEEIEQVTKNQKEISVIKDILETILPYLKVGYWSKMREDYNGCLF